MMKLNDPVKVLFVLLAAFSMGCNTAEQKIAKPTIANRVLSDPLPSWNEGATKKSIVDFVTKTTNAASKDFLPVDDRIA